ncbi:MAG: LTA synthase family protein [Solobacterium sp.]|nr:LTA synthase family protein [Solobacterium sp.]
MGKMREKYPLLLLMLMMSAMIFHDEVFLQVFIGIGHEQYWFIHTLMNSMIYGGCIVLLCSLFPKSFRGKVQLLIHAFVTLVFLISYFVFKQFKIFYDLSTMFSGASDALGQFQNNVFLMLISDEGMSFILVTIAPLVLCFRFRKKLEHLYEGVRWNRTVTAAVTAVCICITSLMMHNGVSALAYDKEYSYQRAIEDFGLLTALRLETGRQKEEEPVFETEEIKEESKISEIIHTPEPVVYEDNSLDIDFLSLSENASATDAKLDEYCASLTPSRQNEYTGIFEGKNLIMITAEAFTKEVIDPDLTPTLYRLMTKGIQFHDYYQPASAGTTGGEYEIIFGAIPTSGGSSFKKMADRNNYMTMGSQLDRLGYNGWAFHNNSYRFYDRHKTHNSIGYSNGFMGYGNGMEEYVEDVWPQSDKEMFEGTIPLYIDAQPFNVYYMTVSGHNNYTPGSNAMAEKNKDRVAELEYSEDVKNYIAANLELEDALTVLVNALEEKGIAEDTVIVLSADHFPYGLDEASGLEKVNELYGFNVTNELERDHNALIIWSGSLEKEEPIIVEDPVSSLDILPTLSNLFHTSFDSRLFAGRDVFSDTMPLVFNVSYEWKTDLGTYVNGVFTPKDENAEIPEDYVDQIKTIVRNKMTFCELFNNTDYFAHIFGEEGNGSE